MYVAVKGGERAIDNGSLEPAAHRNLRAVGVLAPHVYSH